MGLAEPDLAAKPDDAVFGVAALVDSVTVSSVETIAAAAAALSRFAAAHGLRAALCADVAIYEPMVDAEGRVLAADIFGWLGEHERWWQDHHLVLRSPLPRACRYEAEPFWCNGDGFHTSAPNPYLDDIDFGDFFAARFRASAAIIVPVHLPFAQVSANCFVPADRSQSDLSVPFARLGATLGAVTRRFIASYVAAMRAQKRRIPGNCDLTKREVECLRWAAIGKTDREVSMIVGISHATVRYHLQRAAEKLESVTRTQTIFKAGQLGFLGAST